MQTKTITIRPFAKLFTAFVLAAPLSLSLAACDGVEEEDEQDALSEEDEEEKAGEAAEAAEGVEAEYVEAPEEGAEAEEGSQVGPQTDRPLTEGVHATALCSAGNCNYKTPGSQGCLADAVNYNGWAVFSNTFAVYPMVSASCGAQWSRVCNLAGYGGYGIAGWDEYAPNAATAKINTANSGAPPAGYCVDSLMVNAAVTYARACGSDQFGYTACSLYY